MYKKLFLLTILILSIQCKIELFGGKDHSSLFDFFKKQHKKDYSDHDEHNYRQKQFIENIKTILEHQEKDQKAQYGATEFSDMSPEEFENQLLSLQAHKIDENEIPQQNQENEFGLWEMLGFTDKKLEKIDMPKNFDWREKGVLTDVKAQSSCGACWAFTTAATLEAQYAIKHGKKVELSEQQLIDCDTNDDGCGGGLMTDAYKFIQKQGKLLNREGYGDYKNKKEKCHYNKDSEGVKIVNFYQIDKDEYAIQKELYQNGPVAVGVNGRFLQFYTGGVLDNEDCDSRINHAVLLVGWGEEDDGTKYWIIRNQWGAHWGEEGYFRLIRGEKRCGVHTYASIAFVE